MAMTLRLPAELEEELRAAAEEDHRSVHQTVVRAVELYLAARETEEVRADPEALRGLADARAAVGAGDIAYGPEAIQKLVDNPRVS